MSRIAALDPAQAVARSIGTRVRVGRQELGWTLDQLAQRSGVSRRMVVNVEQGSSNPSIATLLRLAGALGIGLPDLVGDTAGSTADPVTVHRAGDLRAVWTSAAGGSAVLVAGTAGPDVTELWDWRLGPADEHRSEAHRAGTEELVLVLSGTLRLRVGDTEQRLAPGDAARFDGGLPHAYLNASSTRPARFSLAVHEPSPTEEPR